MTKAHDRASAAEIRAVLAAWLRAVRDGDSAAVAELATEDVVVIHPDGRTVIGRDALKADFARFFKIFRIDQDVTSEETVVSGDWAFDRATVHTTVTPVTAGEARIVESKVFVVLCRDDPGEWRVARTIAVLVGPR